MSHPPINASNLGSAVLFANTGLTCSFCAPLIMSEYEVEMAAMLIVTPTFGPWRAVDKSKPPLSAGLPTPNPCNVYAGRQHWFLMSV
jgi:hypothetical protein